MSVFMKKRNAEKLIEQKALCAVGKEQADLKWKKQIGVLLQSRKM